jgi:hypothetical protein
MELQLRDPATARVLTAGGRDDARRVDEDGMRGRTAPNRLVPVVAALLAAPFAVLTASARWLPPVPVDD